MDERNLVDQKDVNTSMATVALLIAALALIIAWVSYNKHEGPDLEEKAVMEMEEAADKAEKTTRDATGAMVKGTGEAVKATGDATKKVGNDVKDDSEDNNQ